MFNISRQTLWFIVILTTLISIYYIFFNDECNNHHEYSSKRKYRYKYNVGNDKINYLNDIDESNIDDSNIDSDETSVPSRKKINKKHSHIKRIHISPKIHRDAQLESIKSMTKLLKNRINKTKLNVVEKMQVSDSISTPMSKPIYQPKHNHKKIKIISQHKTKPKYIIKLFFADWCPHCTDLKPVWNKIKDKYLDKILFREVDCTNTNPELDYVQGLPTVALYDSNNKYKYNYENNGDPENFEEFIQKLLRQKLNSN